MEINVLALHPVEQWSHLYPEVKIIGEVTIPQLMFFGTQHLKYNVYFVPSSLEKKWCLPINSLAFFKSMLF